MSTYSLYNLLVITIEKECVGLAIIMMLVRKQYYELQNVLDNMLEYQMDLFLPESKHIFNAYYKPSKRMLGFRFRILLLFVSLPKRGAIIVRRTYNSIPLNWSTLMFHECLYNVVIKVFQLCM